MTDCPCDCAPAYERHALQLTEQRDAARADADRLRGTVTYLRHLLWTFGYFADGKTREDLREEARAAYKATAFSDIDRDVTRANGDRAALARHKEE